MITVVIVIIPIAVHAPAMLVFVPPPLVGVPAALARFVQFMPRVLGLLALIAVMLDCLVQAVVSPRNPLLTIIVCAHLRRRTAEYEKTCYEPCCQSEPAEEP